MVISTNEKIMDGKRIAVKDGRVWTPQRQRTLPNLVLSPPGLRHLPVTGNDLIHHLQDRMIEEAAFPRKHPLSRSRLIT
jgi:hypothetical protein